MNIRGTDASYNVFRNSIDGYWWNQQEDAAMIEKIEFIKGPAGFMTSSAAAGRLCKYSDQTTHKRTDSQYQCRLRQL